jgi:hypothetical protein
MSKMSKTIIFDLFFRLIAFFKYPFGEPPPLCQGWAGSSGVELMIIPTTDSRKPKSCPASMANGITDLTCTQIRILKIPLKLTTYSVLYR